MTRKTTTRTPAAGKPVVLVPACSKQIGDLPFLVAARMYAEGVRLAGGLPLVVPWLEADEIESTLDLAQGVLLTGSPSNVDPSHFGEAVHDPALPLDPQRDAWTLPLVRAALARGMPIIAICRGAQEFNVALGGTLHQAVHEVPGHADHRAPQGEPMAVQFGPAHPVHVAPGGRLASIVGADAKTISVNSLHGQGMKTLAPGIVVEASAPDGLVEAFSLGGARGFNLCLQWHPEWQAAANPVSRRIFAAFGDALLAYRAEQMRAGPGRPREPLPHPPLAPEPATVGA
ncbi:MAG: gamma-glutamyl-gamma-aminobutyrate hydrolase family protein [Rubrivivax sp.]|nr:gamma-glutamyl-gamma-aminobutyrate hydrolase family protein [Rubrivivax sp.]